MILPQMRTPDFEIELFTEDTMVQLLSGPEGKTIGEILKDSRTPVLAFTGTLYREIRYLVEKHKTSELAMFLTIKPLSNIKPHWLAFDLFMPKQRISSAEVVIDATDCEQYFDALKEMPYFQENGLHKNLAHLHSHAQFGVFWSSTDDTEQFSRDELGFHDTYRLYIVVNAKGDIKCSYVGYKPVLHRVDAATCVLYSCPEYSQELTKARKAELDKMAEEAMERRQPVYKPTTPLYNKNSYYGYGASTWYDHYYGRRNTVSLYDDDDFDMKTGEYRPKSTAAPVYNSVNTGNYHHTNVFDAIVAGLDGEDSFYQLEPGDAEIQEFAEGVVARKVVLTQSDKDMIKEVLPKLYSQVIKHIPAATPENVDQYAYNLGSYINGMLFVANNAKCISELFGEELGAVGERLEPKTGIILGIDMVDLLLSDGIPTKAEHRKELSSFLVDDIYAYGDSFIPVPTDLFEEAVI